MGSPEVRRLWPELRLLEVLSWLEKRLELSGEEEAAGALGTSKVHLGGGGKGGARARERAHSLHNVPGGRASLRRGKHARPRGTGPRLWGSPQYLQGPHINHSPSWRAAEDITLEGKSFPGPLVHLFRGVVFGLMAGV